MRRPKISVVIPTHNRPEKLDRLVSCFEHQDLAAKDYELVVVDDGSSPAVQLPPSIGDAACRVVRLTGEERSAARNAGAAEAAGELLVFLDDDLTVGGGFLTAHLRAHQEWSGVIAVGAIMLPDEAPGNPFVRFRQRLEQDCVPTRRGVVPSPNFCTAGNMSVPRELFTRLGGFDTAIASSEDQDLALRHTTRGGQIVFIPEAEAIHHDSALDIKSYCRRVEWGNENIIPFCRQHPGWRDNVERERVNGFTDWRRRPAAESLRKTIKAALARDAAMTSLFPVVALLERFTPESHALDRLYRLLLGLHLFRGYRRGLKRFGAATHGRGVQALGDEAKGEVKA